MDRTKTMPGVVIYPIDGAANEQKVIEAMNIFESSIARQLIKLVKFNDVLHMPGVGPDILDTVQDLLPKDIKIFIDLKIGDVSGDKKTASRGTVENTLRRYAPYAPGIVTVSSIVTAKTFELIRPILPKTKLALFDVPTDMSEAECRLRNFGLSPGQKIAKTIEDFQQLTSNANPFDMVVCSPKEVAYLKSRFGDLFEFIVPGIRSQHMAKDHQSRIMSAYNALKLGADLIVMGAQLSKGNPAKNISPEESQRLTFEEIQHYFNER